MTDGLKSLHYDLIMRVIDNFLGVKQFQELQAYMMSEEITWKYCPYVAGTTEIPDSDPTAFQFIHSFYQTNTLQYDNEVVKLNEILMQLNPQALLRIKANLQPRTPKIRIIDWHTDYTDIIKCTTAVYYINTNDGYTEFKDGTKVNSLENRMVLFNSQLEHRGTTCTNENVRVVINFNFHGGDFDVINQ